MQKTDYSFLKNSTFWLLSALLFCQNSAEYTVDGWLVTYYKNEQILSGSLAAYTVTIQWGFMLLARLLIVYVFKIKNNFKALTVMGIGLSLSYAVLIRMNTPVPALIFLSLFAFSIAGVYPTAVASIGNMMNSASVGIMLSIAGVGGIVFPWLVGIIADLTSLRVGMAFNLIPCIGIAVLPLLIMHKKTA
jgi:fucose permease